MISSVAAAAQPVPAPIATPQAPRFWLPLAVLLLGGAFFVGELDWNISTYEHFGLDPEAAEAQVESGSNGRRLAYGAIGLLGAALLWTAPHRGLRIARGPLIALVGFLVICTASVAWSDDPSLTAKRVAILLLCWLGVFGVAYQFSGRGLMQVALAISAGLIAVGILAELQLGTFRPWEAGYRFAGTVHPNSQGGACAVLALSAFFLRRDARRGRVIYILLFAIGVTFLLLTRSRTCLAGLLLALPVAWLLGSSAWTRLLVGTAAPLALVTLSIAALLHGADLNSNFDAAAQLGRPDLESGFGALNGRLPLWLDLLDYAGDRWLLGYGYHGFWTPMRVYEISVEQGWTLSTAHSVLLDVWLSVGLTGLVCFVWGIVASGVIVLRRCLAGDAVDGFVAAMLVFALISGIFESGFAQPASFDAFIASCGLVYAVSRPRRAPQPDGAGDR